MGLKRELRIPRPTSPGTRREVNSTPQPQAAKAQQPQAEQQQQPERSYTPFNIAGSFNGCRQCSQCF